MQEFDASKGLIHLFFANDDDYFYTDSYVRTDQTYYLYSKLLEGRYEYVISFSGNENSGYFMTLQDNITAAAFSEKNNSFFGGLFSSGRRGSNLPSETNERERTRAGKKVLQINNESFVETLSDVISLMKRKSRAAVIMPMNVFAVVSRYPELCDELRKISAKNFQENNRHILVVTASSYAAESIKYFRPDGSSLSEDNIFTDAGLFPDLEPYFHDVYESSSNFYIYDSIRRFMGDKAVFRNSLSYENIRRMMERLVIQTDCFENIDISDINSMAGVIYSYYNSLEYKKNNNIPFPANPKRSLAAVESEIISSRRLREVLKNASAEFKEYNDPYKYICRVYTDCIDTEGSAFIIGGSSYGEELGMLHAINKIYTKRFGETYPKLDRAIDILSKPCVDGAVSFSATDFRTKIIEMTYKNIVNELTDFVDTGLIDAMLKGLDFYLDYFRTASQLHGEAVTAKDMSFDMYKNVMKFEEKLSTFRKNKTELEQRIVTQENSGDTLAAENTRNHLEKVLDNIKKYETITEDAYRVLALPLSDNNAVSINSKMKYASQTLKNNAAQLSVNN